MFGHFFLDEGLELELHAGMKEVLALLDVEIPKFQCDSYGYDISSFKVISETHQWKLLVKPRSRESATIIDAPVGYVVVQGVGNDLTNLTIPPRNLWSQSQEQAFDSEGKLFSSFIFQMLNALQSKGYIQLPGVLPVA